ncbi:MAG: N-acetylmuramoyl-L-alanine amidase [Pseudomonadota bacterium]|nr:N-acetylmuramoyl-L-alanine amidase [Pseudomonadota bacterium]
MLAWLLGGATAYAAEVALDVGHSLTDTGAISARGRGEYHFNRALAPVVQQALEARGITVRPINYDGRATSLSSRPEAARGADLFLSLHHDSVPAYELSPWVWQGRRLDYCDKYAGFSVHVSRRNPEPAISGRCASAIGASMRLAGFVPTRHHFPKHPWADEENAVHWHDNLVVLHRTTLPAVLFEAGVIKHREEELQLADPERMARMADAIATGVAACLYAMPR